jgi:NADPH:quinone reductase-like Zn-dependent oxidoreductase
VVFLCGQALFESLNLLLPLLHVSPAGVDVVFDPVGGQALFESLKCVAWGALYLVIGFAAGDIPKVRQLTCVFLCEHMHSTFI